MSIEAEAHDFEDMDMDDSNVFWSLTIKPNTSTELPQPKIDGYIVHVTSATFGDQVNKGSRTVVHCTTYTDDSESTSPICVLRENTSETISLDLLFSEMVSFKTSGKNVSEVTLNGYLQPPMGSINPADLEDLEEAKIEEELKQSKKRQRSQISTDDTDINDNKSNDETINKIDDDNNSDNDDDVDDNDDDNDNDDDEVENREVVSPPSPKKRKLNPKKEDKNFKTIKGGIKYKEMRSGKGKILKNGDKVTVKYVGQLQDKSVFDKAITGAGFTFTLGKGEVIKGWDIGLKGMKVGSKGRLIIPPKMAYGTEGSEPSIPPNATLTFTIEVIKAQ